MSKRKRYIPFFLTPSSWFLRGKIREKTKARYYFDGIDLAYKFAEIDHSDDPIALERYRVRARMNFNITSELDGEIELAKLDHADGIDRQIAIIQAEVKHGRTAAKTGEKEIATLRKEPWVGIFDDGYNSEEGISGLYFEFDWNEYWIEELRSNGYAGANDEIIMRQWFADICRAEAAEVLPLSSGVLDARTQVIR